LLRDEPIPGVVRLTFNRPDKLNALSTEMIGMLDRQLDDVAADLSVRVLVLTGAGDRSFVAGADIAEYGGDRLRPSPPISLKAAACSTGWRRCPSRPSRRSAAMRSAAGSRLRCAATS
jgi:enoyl-CoA hydratase/carnithine racemase